MKKSKQAKALQCVDGVDIVSYLPDPILHLILSGLPTIEEIIRTSVLSRRWRYLWTSIPRINIDYWRGLDPWERSSRNKPDKNKFTEFVYRVLLNKSLELDSFRLCCYFFYDMSTLGQWIHAAVTRNVKQLHLVFRPRNRNAYENIEMPHCLVTSCSLEVLRLFLLRGSLSLPDYTGFPSLRVIELNGVRLLAADIVKSFFESCPFLEDLSLIDCLIDTLEILCISCLKLKSLRVDNRVMLDRGTYYPCSVLQICCPKLVFLELSDAIAYKFFFNSLESLKKAIVHPHKLQTEDMDDTVCELFTRISHVEYLSISLTFAFKCIDPEVDVPVSLPNVKTLEITMDCGSVDNVLQFLKNFPNLESLHFNILRDSFTPKCWKIEKPATNKIFTQQLKKVVLVGFYGNLAQLDIARFFLKHGKALEEIVFIWPEEAKFKMETMNGVSEFQKASSNVKLISYRKRYTQGSTYFSEV